MLAPMILYSNPFNFCRDLYVCVEFIRHEEPFPKSVLVCRNLNHASGK